MSAEKKYTERDMVLARREAFAEGACYAVDDSRYKDEWLSGAAARKYPLPRVTRPRVVNDPHESGIKFKIDGELLYWCSDTVGWVGFGNNWYPNTPHATQQRVRVWADLLANPTEEIEDGE